MTYDLSGNDIKKIIKDNDNLTQAELSIKCGVSKSTVSKWLNEKRAIPDNQLENIYQYIDVGNEMSTYVNVSEEVAKEEKYEMIRQDLLNQLERQNKYGRHYVDLVDHAVNYFKLKDELESDIKKHGLRVKLKTGNNNVKEVDNASIRNVNQVSAQLLRVLKDLGLNEPDVDDEEIDEDDFT